MCGRTPIGRRRRVVRTVLRKCLECGDIKQGFARVRSPREREELFVAFSCRGRCPCSQQGQSRNSGEQLDSPGCLASFEVGATGGAARPPAPSFLRRRRIDDFAEAHDSYTDGRGGGRFGGAIGSPVMDGEHRAKALRCVLVTRPSLKNLS